MQSWERLNKLRLEDPKEFAKHEHLHTTHPLLYKTEQEKKRIEATLRKYITLEKQDKRSEKEAAMFGEAASKLDTSCDSTASSDDNEESNKGVYFSEEEIQLLSDSDKLIYMNKLLHESLMIDGYMTEVISKVKDARRQINLAIDSIADTLKMYEDYFERQMNLLMNVTVNMGCYDEQEEEAEQK